MIVRPQYASSRLPLLVLILGLGTACASPEPRRARKEPARGQTAIPSGWTGLKSLARRHGYRHEVDADGHHHRLRKPGAAIQLDTESRVCYFDGNLHITDSAPIARDDDVFVSTRLGSRIAGYSQSEVAANPRPVATKPKPSTRRRGLKGFRVVLDPGHGGKDPGALRGHTREKDINLLVTLEAAKMLEWAGAKVTLTRRGDRFISLDERARISNRSRPDVFVSIHVNASTSAGPRGIEVYRAAKAGPGHRGDKLARSRRLARSVYDRLETVSPTRDRGVKPSPGYRVLRKNAHPAILVELGFLSNAGERERLNSARYRRRLAEAIARGIEDYASGSLREVSRAE